MYRIRFNIKSFQDAYWVSTVKRYKCHNDNSIRECNISTFTYWKCKNIKTAEKMLDDLILYSEKPDLYEIEEF